MERYQAVDTGVIKLILSIVVIIASALMVLLVLLHKGKGGGLSDLFGGGFTSSAGSSTVVERNLDRFTIGVGVVWFIALITLAILATKT